MKKYSSWMIALVRSILKHVLMTETDFMIAGEASNGRKTIDLNLKLKPDFIVMDINMPVKKTKNA